MPDNQEEEPQQEFDTEDLVHEDHNPFLPRSEENENPAPDEDES